VTQEHFDEAFDFATSLAEQRRRRDEEERRRTDPIYGKPGEAPDEWYARRLREVREKNFHNLDVAENIKPPLGRMVPRFDERPATHEELSQIARDWLPLSKAPDEREREQTIRALIVRLRDKAFLYSADPILDEVADALERFFASKRKVRQP